MKLAAMALSGTILLSGAAFGLDMDPSFYIGGEAAYNKLKNNNSRDFQDSTGRNSFLRKKSSPSLGLNLGSRITENFGLELGYTALKQSKNSYTVDARNSGTFNVKMRNPYIDALGYIPVANDIDMIASIGLGRLSTKIDSKINVNGAVVALTDVQKNAAKTKTGLRLGLGAQYKFDSNFGARVMLRHQKGNKLIKNVNSAGVGLFYQF